MTYTSGPNDVSTGVVIVWGAFRPFTVTAGQYYLESVLEGSREEPAFGLITNISLSTMVFSHFADETEAEAIVGLLIGTNDFKEIATGAVFGYDELTNDILNQNGRIDIHPTSVGQVFTVHLPADSRIASVPEPSAITLLCIGIAGLAGYRWRRNTTGSE